MKQFMNVVLAGVAAITLGGANTATPAVSPSPAASPSPIVVHIADFQFNPAAITVHVGDTISFINDDEAAHTVTADGKSFDSGNLDQNQKWSFTFKKSGTFTYICAYHPMMKASIKVEPANQ